MRLISAQGHLVRVQSGSPNPRSVLSPADFARASSRLANRRLPPSYRSTRHARSPFDSDRMIDGTHRSPQKSLLTSATVALALAPPHTRPMMPQHAPEQRSQDRIFRYMTAFTHDQLNQHNGLERNLRMEPEQKRNEKTRCVLRRQQIGRASKDQKHPREEKHPINDEPACLHVQNERLLYCFLSVKQLALQRRSPLLL